MLALGLYDGVTPLYFFSMTLLFALPSVIFCYYYEVGFALNTITIRRMIVLFYLIAGINTLFVLNEYPMAAKVLAMADSVADEKQYYESLGCGGYNFIYSFVFLFLPLILSLKTDTYFWKTITIITIVCNVIVLYKSQYTIASLLTVMSVLIYLITKLLDGSKRGLIVGYLLIVILSLGLFYLPQLFYWLSDLTTASEGMALRFNEVASYLETGDAGYNLGSRLDRYSWSWDSFLEHPLLGAQFFDGGTYGQHSSLIDQLARFGVVGTVGYIIFIYNYFKFFSTRINKRMALTSTIVFLMFSLLNPTIYIFQVGMVLLFSVPTICMSDTSTIINEGMNINESSNH